MFVVAVVTFVVVAVAVVVASAAARPRRPAPLCPGSTAAELLARSPLAAATPGGAGARARPLPPPRVVFMWVMIRSLKSIPMSHHCHRGAVNGHSRWCISSFRAAFIASKVFLTGCLERQGFQEALETCASFPGDRSGCPAHPPAPLGVRGGRPQAPRGRQSATHAQTGRDFDESVVHMSRTIIWLSQAGESAAAAVLRTHFP